ncbi:MAG TPA: tetratricopeptide repeat protein [Candidatus Acidoferrales bacterium]|nr:tetratricopeptide repeat protein [Candidatus Acidoferrales bacterium]
MSVGRAAGSPAQTVGRPRAAATTENRGAQSPAKISVDWMTQVRARVAAHDLEAAEKIVDARLAAAPEDSDALGWRAQLLAWSGKRAEAEAAFRRALELSPRDADFLLGLARLLAQDGRNGDALALLDSAAQIPPARADVLIERGRVLAAMGRKKAARADFLQARALEPANISPADDEAAAGLRSLDVPTELPRFEMDFGNETDTFNYTNAANAQMVTFVAKPKARWIFSGEADSYQRFGALAQKAIGAATFRLDRANSFTIAGGGGNADGIIPRAETYFEYGHGFRISESAPLRGVEFAYNQHWLWYENAHVLALTGTAAADFARDFRWTVSANGARSGFDGDAVAWKPSGYSRLEFPLPRVNARRLLLNATFAVGAENFSELDQVGAFASRTFGGGARVGFTSRQFVNFYVARQLRNGGRTENMYGVSYGVRF